MATLNDLAAAEADRDNSNRLLDECRLERNVLQKICAERSDEIARLHDALRKIADPLSLQIAGIGMERALKMVKEMQSIARQALG